MTNHTVNDTPLSVHIFATSRCNLNCRHCFIEATSFSRNHKDLSSNAILNAVNIIHNISSKVDFEIEGGEIIMHPQFPDIIGGIDEEVFPNITITTNGTNSIDFAQMKLCGHKGSLRLRVSAEGHNEKIHNILRSSKLADAFQFVEQGSKTGVNTVIRTTLHSENIEYISEMISAYAAAGAREIQFLEFQQCGRGKQANNKHLVIDETAFKEAVNEFCSVAIPNDIQRMTLSLSSRRLKSLKSWNNHFFQSATNKMGCKDASLTFNWDGSISICPWEPHETVIADRWPDDLSSFVINKLESGKLFHECDFCSAFKFIRGENAK
ncbi:radical SAM protein [Maridesulfovibrio hydrothermalis]|uniref:Radical SAM core domain-containing protein n=1 Tax=Maridesulfovibrio hydrothermalis AM13 = DSM 14728 TaxID=1121451 RepID=L0R9N3_9BACT|nr:radical SAM protein [Maridesulfovibrio hydrothermalis]CCO22306.1 protein of unknown function [Maridesulfovibrio hydrothermalis AM13 = DSM 14728]